MNDPRYNSRTSLSKTKKEERLDNLENMIGDISDDLYKGLKKLSIQQMRELHKAIAERILECNTKN